MALTRALEAVEKSCYALSPVEERLDAAILEVCHELEVGDDLSADTARG